MGQAVELSMNKYWLDCCNVLLLLISIINKVNMMNTKRIDKLESQPYLCKDHFILIFFLLKEQKKSSKIQKHLSKNFKFYVNIKEISNNFLFYFMTFQKYTQTSCKIMNYFLIK